MRLLLAFTALLLLTLQQPVTAQGKISRDPLKLPSTEETQQMLQRFVDERHVTSLGEVLISGLCAYTRDDARYIPVRLVALVYVVGSKNDRKNRSWVQPYRKPYAVKNGKEYAVDNPLPGRNTLFDGSSAPNYEDDGILRASDTDMAKLGAECVQGISLSVYPPSSYARKPRLHERFVKLRMGGKEQQVVVGFHIFE